MTVPDRGCAVIDQAQIPRFQRKKAFVFIGKKQKHFSRGNAFSDSQFQFFDRFQQAIRFKNRLVKTVASKKFPDGGTAKITRYN